MSAAMSSIDPQSPNKISFSKPDRLPTLLEKMAILDSWFKSCASAMDMKYAKVPIGSIAELLVSKRVAADKDSAVNIILKGLNMVKLADGEAE